MRVTGETVQPIVINLLRGEGKQLSEEIKDALVNSDAGEHTPIRYPKIHELWSMLLAAEQRYAQEEYDGPG